MDPDTAQPPSASASRRLSPPPHFFSSPTKRRRASPPPAEHPRPFKRRAGPLHPAYIETLNQAVDEARLRTSLDPGPASAAAAAGSRLATSQVGCTLWTEHEKTACFEALARLGRDDIAGIAAQLRSKSEPEVAQYLALLDGVKHQRRQSGRLLVLHPADIPAAAEISQPCVIALEAAADAVSLRQDQHEETIEKRRWGEALWRIDACAARRLEDERAAGSESEDVPFAALFHTERFLLLARRVFMNAAVPEYNWEFVDDEEPAIRATALEDLHALVLVMTRRIVHTALTMAAGRIAAKSRDQAVQKVVRQRDVEAAVASMGLKSRKEFWATAPRRLRLKVIDDSVEADSTGPDADGGANGVDERYDEVHGADAGCLEGESRGELEALYKTMTYDEVESRLLPRTGADDATGSADSADEPYSSSTSPPPDADEPSATPSPPCSRSDSPLFPHSPPPPTQQTADDLDELFAYTAVDFGNPHSAEGALLRRLRVEQAFEDVADAADADAAQAEERRLWEAVGKAPPADVRAPERAGASLRKGLATAAVGDMYCTEGWREHVDYVPEWEAGL
ncbi:hypothetical protein BROUX41_001584 [Berkeleyomyces rouxiae]|uniref:uncharacterized protein n=1 Tax=Berkeleyomyces rouxiae TaxID=2035830 RepID=UPI003B7BB9FE